MQSNLLYSKTPVVISGGKDRQSHPNDNKGFRKDDNLEDCEDRFGVKIDSKHVRRVPLKFFCNFGKIKIPTQIELEVRCALQTEMKKLFK